MKAMILAAGFGTRLLPTTTYLPKPLFPIAGTAIMDRIIHKLIDAGADEVIINAHHLYKKMESHIKRSDYSVPVHLKYEPKILDTGGAVKNISTYLDDQPFVLINADIYSDIDIKKAYDAHIEKGSQATLILHDLKKFNKVAVNDDDFITGFNGGLCNDPLKKTRILAFTGIHIINPQILDMIPENKFYSIIDLYKRMISKGLNPRAHVTYDQYWKDIGTPEAYKEVVLDRILPETFGGIPSTAPPSLPEDKKASEYTIDNLKGDGSGRLWQRAAFNGKSLIIADHGINASQETLEVDAFVNIGTHLRNKKIPIPKIYGFDRFSGIVLLEDLGNVHLQDITSSTDDADKVRFWYKKTIDSLVAMSVKGYEAFDPCWTHQTREYSKEMIIEKECKYFTDSFLKHYLNMAFDYKIVEKEFETLAEAAAEKGNMGFMHRDFHSRNIMIHDEKVYYIDFQGGRKGPLQYDLASLLIDPYVDLSMSLQIELTDYCMEQLSKEVMVDRKEFLYSLNFCKVTRNLQMLGAFAHLSLNMKKKQFEQYIPTALENLKTNIKQPDILCPILQQIINGISLPIKEGMNNE